MARRNLGGGHIELLEIKADGDTAWSRRLAPPPVSLTPDQVDALVDNLAQGLGRTSPTPPAAMRAAVREALYIPDPLPGARDVMGTASGEVWFTGSEREDTLGVWYAVRRDNDPAGVRRILLPPGFRAMDATDTHVWGFRRDDLGVQYVVGLRLVPPTEER